MTDILDSCFRLYKEQLKDEINSWIKHIEYTLISEPLVRLPYSSLICENKAFTHVSKLVLEKYFGSKIVRLEVYEDDVIPKSVEIIFEDKHQFL